LPARTEFTSSSATSDWALPAPDALLQLGLLSSTCPQKPISNLPLRHSATAMQPACKPGVDVLDAAIVALAAWRITADIAPAADVAPLSIDRPAAADKRRGLLDD
jgi:hypothetical protein